MSDFATSLAPDAALAAQVWLASLKAERRMAVTWWTSDRVARRVLRAVRRNRRYVVVGLQARWLWRLKRLAPRIRFPFVHARSDMREEEYRLLMRQAGAERFNLHPARCQNFQGLFCVPATVARNPWRTLGHAANTIILFIRFPMWFP